MEEAFIINKNHQPKKWFLIAIPTAALIIMSVIYFMLVWWPAYKQPAKYTYTKLDNYKLLGSTKGQGISFSKPVELTKQVSAKNQIELTHLIKKRSASHLAAASTVFGTALTEDELLVLNANLTFTDSKYYKDVTDPIRQFATDKLPAGWATKLGGPKKFTSKSIKKDAWMMDVSSTEPAGKKTPIKGEVVFAVSGNRYYYFIVLTPDYNWQANQKTWQQVLNSLQIDQ